jgi:adenylosuccinate lyase
MDGYAELLRRCDPELQELWSYRYQVITERQLWLEVLKFHTLNGVVDRETGDEAISCYRQNAHHVDIERIRARELVTRHDVKARIEEFNYLSGGFELIHLGMTSADVVDNVSLIRMRDTDLLFDRRFPDTKHDRPPLPFRGIKGAVGTAQDQLNLLGGDTAKLEQLEQDVAERFGWTLGNVLDSVGQVYPRSIDLMWANYLCERVEWPWPSGLASIHTGYLTTIAAYSGDQWNEGDVSTSVTRRVALPAIAATTWLALQEKEMQQ